MTLHSIAIEKRERGIENCEILEFILFGWYDYHSTYSEKQNYLVD